MITAVDTSVLLDVFADDPRFMRDSRDALRSALKSGGVVACEVVWAETAAFFPSPEAAVDAMQTVGIGFDPLTRESALAAAAAWARYRAKGGRRARVSADFLIGAHAATQADRLLTRDRGFYRSYFRHLGVFDPS